MQYILNKKWEITFQIDNINFVEENEEYRL